ncbi:hypothetical protein [Polaromonas sp.]|uniref:hypothetical protein n=1 Tax=Polaromonas sp. TaxID=1869339 RepID=UPI001816E8DE|nr:hypothetical protein [Polaromonas sp.]NMM07224.1 hypothetical protein [Polaromonas sp.]
MTRLVMYVALTTHLVTPASPAPLRTHLVTPASPAPLRTHLVTPASLAPLKTHLVMPASPAPLKTHLVTPASLAPLKTHLVMPASLAPLKTHLAVSAVPMMLPVAPAKLTTRLPAACNSDIRAVRRCSPAVSHRPGKLAGCAGKVIKALPAGAYRPVPNTIAGGPAHGSPPTTHPSQQR